MTTLAASRRGHIGVEAGPPSAVGRSGVSFFRSVPDASAVPSLSGVISNALRSIYEKDYFTVPSEKESDLPKPEELPRVIEELKKEMKKAADRLEFEKAGEIRNRIRALREKELAMGVRI